MKKLMVTTAVLAGLAHLGSPILEACGAKFLVAARVARYQRQQYTANPAKILVYRHTNDTEDVEFVAKLKGMLEGVGHSVTVAASEADLRDATRTHDFNIVMMEIDVARQLREDLGSWSPASTVLPIMLFATRREASGAKREFGQVIKLPAKENVVLATVHRAYSAK